MFEPFKCACQRSLMLKPQPIPVHLRVLIARHASPLRLQDLFYAPNTFRLLDVIPHIVTDKNWWSWMGEASLVCAITVGAAC